MDTEDLEAITSLILIVIADIVFSKVMIEGRDLKDIIFYFLVILPVFTVIFIHIIIPIVSFIFDVLQIELPEPKPKKPKRRGVPNDVRYRCEALLKVVEAIQHSNNVGYLSIDNEMLHYASEIRMYMITDGRKAVSYCEMLEEFLYRNRTTVAQVPEGYMWLRAVGAI